MVNTTERGPWCSLMEEFIRESGPSVSKTDSECRHSSVASPCRDSGGKEKESRGSKASRQRKKGTVKKMATSVMNFKILIKNK